MALINCPDCGTEISDAAPSCPKCGRPMALPAPSAYAKDRVGRARSPAAFTLTLSSFVLAVLAIAAAVWFVPAFEIGENLQASCQVNGGGQGQCQFTNTGWTPGSQCVDVSLRNGTGGAVRSGPVCSGRVWPSDTVEKSIMIVIGHTCDGPLGYPDLSNVCTMDVQDADTNGADAGPTRQRAAPSPNPGDDAGADGGGQAPSGALSAAAVSAAPAATAAPAGAPTTPAPATSVQATAVADSGVPSVPSPSSVDASGPSFDCSGVTDATALTICSNPGLSQLDRQMAALYVAREQAAPDATVRDAQRAWLVERDQCGGDAVCLQHEYAARIEQLQQ